MKSNRITNSEQFFKPKTIFHNPKQFIKNPLKKVYWTKIHNLKKPPKKTQNKKNKRKKINKKDSTPNSAIHPWPWRGHGILASFR